MRTENTMFFIFLFVLNVYSGTISDEVYRIKKDIFHSYQKKEYGKTKKLCEEFIKKVQKQKLETEEYTLEEVFLIWGKSHERTFDFLNAYKVYEIAQKFFKNRNNLYTLEILHRKKTIRRHNLSNKKIASFEDTFLINYIDDVVSFLLKHSLVDEALKELETLPYDIIEKNPNLLLKFAIVCNDYGEKIAHYSDIGDKKSTQYKTKAEKILRKIVTTIPNTEYAQDSQYYLGYMFSDNITIWNNDYKKALQEYEKFLRWYNKSILSVVVIENMYFCYKNLNYSNNEILEKFNKILKQYEENTLISFVTKYYIGLCLYEEKNYKEAMKYFSSALSDYKKLDFSKYNLTTFLTYLKDRYKEIIFAVKTMHKKCVSFLQTNSG